jgi:hypothetical protein
MGCWPDHLYAWNEQESVGIDVFIANAFALPQAPSNLTINLEDPGNLVMVETGKQIPDNFCVEKISIIPVARVYESTSGVLEVEIDHINKRLGVELNEVTLKDPTSKHELTIPKLTFPIQDLYRKR